MGQQVLFSEVDGVVVREGTPVSGVQVTRSYLWGWNSSSGSDRVVTDQAGSFHFPVIIGKSLLGGLLPHEPSIEQKILLTHAGKTYEVWVSRKRNYDKDGELDGRPMRLRCDLSSEPKRFETGPNGRGYFGICALR